MTVRLYILLITFLTACNSDDVDKNSETNSNDSFAIQSKVQNIDTLDIKIDTLLINYQKLILTKDGRRPFCLRFANGDTIIKYADFYNSADFLDIDEDGYKDIRIYVFSNTPNQCENYLFDKKLKNFNRIENCSLDIVKVSGTNFYYSYNRAGCSDARWQSHLSKIENNQLVDYGEIYGNGCESDNDIDLRTIEIYKIFNSNFEDNELIEDLPYAEHIIEWQDKWNFIDTYWASNYSTFER